MPDELLPEKLGPVPVAPEGASKGGEGPGVPPAVRPAGEAPEGIDLKRYVAALKRYKWLPLLGAVAGLGAGVVMTRFDKPVYQAQTTIWVAQSGGGRGSSDRGPIEQGQLFAMPDWGELLTSYTVLDYAVSRLRLYLQVPRGADSVVFSSFSLQDRFRPGSYRLKVSDAGDSLTLSTAEGSVLQAAAVGDSVGQALGFNWVLPRSALTPGKSVAFTLITPRDAATALAQQLRVQTARQTNFISLVLNGPNPALIAATVNAVAERYVELATQLKREKLTELAAILDRQLQQAERSLRENEAALQGFRVNTITLPSDRGSPVAPGLTVTQSPVLQNFFSMKVEQEQVRRDREAIEQALATHSDSNFSVDALEGVGAVQRSSELMAALRDLTQKRAELRALRARYTDDHLPVQRLIQDVRSLEDSTIPKMARSVVAQLRVRDGELSSLVGSASGELQQIPPRAIQEARLQRDVDIASTLYTTLQQRYSEARLAEVSSTPDLRILDAAVTPEQPIRNTAKRLMLMGLVGGFGFGVLGALLLDRFDRKVRYPTQVTSQLGLTILGVLPHFAARNGKSDPQPVIEALRGVRLNLGYAYGTAGPLVVTVSSPESGDGKSFVASNLALSFADAGYKTLLIDGDSRRGTLHRVLKASRKPGLTDLLAGRASTEGAVTQTDYPLLHLLTCGSRTAEAPELLSSAALLKLMTSLRPDYGAIIVDSPPLGAGVDAFALAVVTGNLLMVLRTGATDREMAEAKLDVLDRLPVRILGAVMNDVKEWGTYRYHTYYMPGYELEEETGGRRDRKVLGRG